MNGQQFRTSHPSDNDAMKSFDQESTFFDKLKDSLSFGWKKKREKRPAASGTRDPDGGYP